MFKLLKCIIVVLFIFGIKINCLIYSQSSFTGYLSYTEYTSNNEPIGNSEYYLLDNYIISYYANNRHNKSKDLFIYDRKSGKRFLCDEWLECFVIPYNGEDSLLSITYLNKIKIVNSIPCSLANVQISYGFNESKNAYPVDIPNKHQSIKEKNSRLIVNCTVCITDALKYNTRGIGSTGFGIFLPGLNYISLETNILEIGLSHLLENGIDSKIMSNINSVSDNNSRILKINMIKPKATINVDSILSEITILD